MTERFDFLEKRGYGYCIGIIDNQTGKHLGYVGIRDLMNQLHKENQILKEKLCELGVSDVKCYGKRIDTGLEEWLE